MPSARGDVAGDLITGALCASEPGDGCQAALDTIRDALHADRTLLTRSIDRWSRPVVHHTSPSGDRQDVPIDLDAIGAALDAEGALEIARDEGGPTVLALALRPRDDVPWCLTAARAGDAAWTEGERTLLTAAAPALTLVLEHATSRRQLAGREGEVGSGTAMRGRFLSLLSHELRNPLAPILMWTSTLRRLRRDDAEVQRATQAIEHAVGLARTLLEEVSEVSRLERGLLEVQRLAFDLRDPIRGALELVRPGLEERKMTLLEDIPDDPVPVQGDPVRLKQVVGHLLGNALKFSSNGDTIAVQVTRAPDRAEVRVSDSGPGLPDVVLPQLFTPFVQGPNARGGLGVGLAITRRLLALHGGTIEAIPRGERGGATFVATLPLHGP